MEFAENREICFGASIQVDHKEYDFYAGANARQVVFLWLSCQFGGSQNASLHVDVRGNTQRGNVEGSCGIRQIDERAEGLRSLLEKRRLFWIARGRLGRPTPGQHLWEGVSEHLSDNSLHCPCICQFSR